MLWLDSAYPLDKPVDDPGVKRGDCPGGVESTPSYLRQNFPDSYVTFQNVAIGEIGSTIDYSFPTQTPSLTPIATPTDAPVAAPGLCKNSCYNSSRPWEKLCQKEKCAGCPECTVSPTDAPVEPPVNGGDYCCTWNYYNCGIDSFCNESSANCQGECGGTWLSKSAPAMQCIAKYLDCTADTNACCEGLTCQGDGSYNQCLD